MIRRNLNRDSLRYRLDRYICVCGLRSRIPFTDTHKLTSPLAAYRTLYAGAAPVALRALFSTSSASFLPTTVE